MVPALAAAALLLVAVTVAFLLPYMTSGSRRAEQPIADRVGAPGTEGGRLHAGYAPSPTSEAVSAERADRPALDLDNARAGGRVGPTDGEPPAPPAGLPVAEGFVNGHMDAAKAEAPVRGLGAFDESRGRAEVAERLEAARPPVSEEAKEGAAGARFAGVAAGTPEVATKDGKAVVAKSAAAAEVRRPAFHSVVLYTSDVPRGTQAFQESLREFRLLSTLPPAFSTRRPMTEAEFRRYSSVLRDVHHSPDVVSWQEMEIRASDLELIEAVFSESVELSYAEPSTDVKALNQLLAQSRQLSALRSATSRPTRHRAVGVRSSWEEARQAYEYQMEETPGAEMVNVVVVLKRTPETEPAAPATQPTPPPDPRRPR